MPKRTFSPMNIVAAAFNICQTWAGAGVTSVLEIAHGDGVDLVFYGMVIMIFLYGATATIITVPPQIVIGIARFCDAAYVNQRWHTFLSLARMKLKLRRGRYRLAQTGDKSLAAEKRSR
ncbi:hypothetical protein EV356DRAFT_530883 [Viridothelium virens]|uniref:Uncharacterized protein n=1 Tax=Viridothelium virens TaxID=1048519 RepID=A0A6A6HEP3_VIRVR|nr:hypothetical protein EV356DRAFT_530883 [Viridothelium virens]